MAQVVARSQYDERPVFLSDLSFVGEISLTKQSDAQDCDINNLFKRFEKTGQLPNMIIREPRYGDFSQVLDFQGSLEVVRKAQEQFAHLDANLRNRFDNDPAKFLEFVNNADNVDELEKMGLLKPEVVQARKAAREAAAAEVKQAEADKAAQDERALIDKIKAEIAAG